MRKFFFSVLATIAVAASLAQAGEPLQTAGIPPAAGTVTSQTALPAPNRTGGMTLTEALAHRRSVRSFKSAPLTLPETSQLLWAAQGITDDQGHRTAPSAHAAYFLHVYLATANGFFEYLPTGHQLRKLSDKDLRTALSAQKSVAAAPAVFLVTGEYDRAAQPAEAETGQRLVNLEAGHAAQNLLLQATALGLGAVPVGGIQPKQVQQAASLPANRIPIYLIPVGHAD
jgi:SagB-type dehydrogenase family enzyme